MNNLAKEYSWTNLLVEAVVTPGRILEAYSAFHNYSFGNQLLALLQCDARGIQPGPLATYNAWRQKGRSVIKGEKAIVLCVPRTYKVKSDSNSEDSERRRISFNYEAKWFTLAQTQGPEYELPNIPSWDKRAALNTLGITEVPFVEVDGNIQGYAQNKSIAINPLAQMPAKTLFHELAHVLLGHTKEVQLDDEVIPRNIREVSAELVALLCCESLSLPGANYCRWYIQSWLSGEQITASVAQSVFSCADKIVKAGHSAAT